MIIRKDATTEYPDINEIISTRRQSATMPSNQSRSTYFTQSVMLKITLLVNPQTENASKDLDKCVSELARESGQGENRSWIPQTSNAMDDIVEEKYKLHATIPSLNTNFQFQVNLDNIFISLRYYTRTSIKVYYKGIHFFQDQNRRNGRRPLSVRLRGKSQSSSYIVQ